MAWLIRGTIYSINTGCCFRVEGTVVLAYVGVDGTVVTQVINADTSLTWNGAADPASGD